MMKGKLSGFLMVLVILILLGFIGMATYYQISLNRLNEDYMIKDRQLDSALIELEAQLTLARNLNSTLRNLSSDINSYTGEFEKVYGMCDSEKAELAAKLDRVIEDLEVERKDRETKLAQLKSVKTAGTDMKDRISSIRTNSFSIVDRLDATGSNIDSIQADIIAYTSEGGSCSDTIRSVETLVNEAEVSLNRARSEAGINSNYATEAVTKLNAMLETLKNY